MDENPLKSSIDISTNTKNFEGLQPTKSNDKNTIYNKNYESIVKTTLENEEIIVSSPMEAINSSMQPLSSHINTISSINDIKKINSTNVKNKDIESIKTNVPPPKTNISIYKEYKRVIQNTKRLIYKIWGHDMSIPIYKNSTPEETTQRVYNFLLLPQKQEHFLLLGQIVCLDTLQHSLTFFPIKVFVGFFYIILYILTWNTKWLVYSSKYKQELVRGGIILLIFLSLSGISNAAIYHYIRVQSLMKQAALFHAQQIFDRLLASLGDDILDTLYITLENPNNNFKKNLQHITLAQGYMCLHTLVSQGQVLALNVTLNSSSNVLLVILQTSNMGEQNSFIFKRFFHANLFQISCSDAVERFQQLFSICVIIIQNIAYMGLEPLTIKWQRNASQAFFQVLMFEMCVDIIKHAFITKFNQLPDYYHTFRIVVCRDIVVHRLLTKEEQKKYLYCYSVQKRFGYVHDPLVIVTLRALVSPLLSLHISYWITILLIISLLLFIFSLKFFITSFLLSYSCNFLLKEYKTAFDLSSIPLPNSTYTKKKSSTIENNFNNNNNTSDKKAIIYNPKQIIAYGIVLLKRVQNILKQYSKCNTKVLSCNKCKIIYHKNFKLLQQLQQYIQLVYFMQLKITTQDTNKSSHINDLNKPFESTMALNIIQTKIEDKNVDKKPIPVDHVMRYAMYANKIPS